DVVLDALAEADAERPLAGRRFTYEHCFGVIRPEHYRRLLDWGFVMAPNPALAYFGAGRSAQMHEALDDVRIAKSKAPDPDERVRREWAMALRSWFDAGFVVTG